MNKLDFSSWEGVVTTLIGLVVVTVLMVSIRLLVMETVQQRRQRENRQINERLRILIAAYKTLGGSFTGDLAVDPSHLRDRQRQRALAGTASGTPEAGEDDSATGAFDRPRRIRDAVEAALSDVILLGTEDQVRLAAQAATELTAGRSVHTDELVVSLRDFIRKVLDLEPVSTKFSIPKQGPTRPGSGGGGGGKGKGDAGGGDRGGGKQGGGGALGGGMGMGLGGGLAHGAASNEGHGAESSL